MTPWYNGTDVPSHWVIRRWRCEKPLTRYLRMSPRPRADLKAASDLQTAASWLLAEDYEAFKARNVAQIPLRRVGTPDEQAAVITFLCSEDASYVSGQILSVSGGA